MFERIKRWLCNKPERELGLEPGPPDMGINYCLKVYREGLAYFQSGDYAAAERSLMRALDYRHDFAEAHFYLGLIYRRQHRSEDAMDELMLATTFKPNFEKGWFYLGVLALDLGRSADAGRNFNTALRIRPDYAEAYNGLGNMYQAQLRHREAVTCFKRAIELNPHFAIAYNNLANVMIRGYADADAADRYVAKALDINPRLAEAYNNLAMIRQYQGRCEEALLACKQSLSIDPHSKNTLWIRALARLMLGRYAEGWSDYEVRRHVLPTFGVRKFPYPEWTGAALHGCDVLVYNEQGLGDEIMFASCLPDLFALGGRFVVECSGKLEDLFRRSFAPAFIQVTDQDRPDMSYLTGLPRFDWQIAAGSLPRYFRTKAADFVRPTGYLRAEADRVRHWRAHLQRAGPGRKIGLSWRGGRPATNQTHRSIELETLVPLLSTHGVTFVSLQYGDCVTEIEQVRSRHNVALHHWQEAIDDYDETAALVSALDLVVSVQTAIVHLGGALGKPVWVMVPSSPEWRYMASGNRMPWYPSARLFRQKQGESWAPVIDQLINRLKFDDQKNQSRDEIG